MNRMDLFGLEQDSLARCGNCLSEFRSDEMNPLKTLKILPCGHRLCFSCANNAESRGAFVVGGQSKPTQCPLCFSAPKFPIGAPNSGGLFSAFGSILPTRIDRPSSIDANRSSFRTEETFPNMSLNDNFLMGDDSFSHDVLQVSGECPNFNDAIIEARRLFNCFVEVIGQHDGYHVQISGPKSSVQLAKSFLKNNISSRVFSGFSLVPFFRLVECPAGKVIPDETIQEISLRTNTTLKPIRMNNSDSGKTSFAVYGNYADVESAIQIFQNILDFGLDIQYDPEFSGSEIDTVIPRRKSFNITKSRLPFASSSRDAEQAPLSQSYSGSSSSTLESLFRKSESKLVSNSIMIANSQRVESNEDDRYSLSSSSPETFLPFPSPTIYHHKHLSVSSPLENDESLSTLNIDCPLDRAKFLAGPKIGSLKSIMKNTNTSISIYEPRPDSTSQRIEIKGKYDNAVLALQLIQSLLEMKVPQFESFSGYSHSPLELPDQINLASSPSKESAFSTQSGYSSPFRPKASGEMISSELFCPTEKVSIIIGAKGVIIKEISKRSNAQISISEESKSVADTDGDKSSLLRRIEIRGTHSEIEVAKSLILSVVQFGPNSIFNSSSQSDGPKTVSASKVTVEIACPKEKVGAIIGSKGSVVRELIKISNTQISVTDEITSVPSSMIPGSNLPHEANPTPIEVRMVSIRGFPDDVPKAVQMIEDIIKGSSNLPIVDQNLEIDSNNFLLNKPNDLIETIQCPIEKVGEVIGWKGVVIKNISQQSGARIIISEDVNHSLQFKTIEIRGTGDQITAAKSMLLEIINTQGRKSRNASRDLDVSSFGQHNLMIKLNSASLSNFRVNFYQLIQDILAESSSQLLVHDDSIEISSDSEDLLLDAVQMIVDVINKSTGHQEDCLVENLSCAESILHTLLEPNIDEHLALNHQVKFQLVDCPYEKSYLFLGHRGAGVIKDLVLRSGAKISFMKFAPKHKSNLISRKIIISGLQAEVDKARQQIDILLNDSFGDSSKSKVDVSTEDSVEKPVTVGTISSSETDTIESSGILIDSELDASSQAQGDSFKELDDGNLVHCSIECPNEKVGLIIGSKGVVIKSMMNRSKAKIVVTSENVNGKTLRHVEITGTDAQVKAAKDMVDCVIKYGNEALDQSGMASLGLGIITKFIELPFEQIRHVIGPRGATLRQIYQESLASITISKNSPDDPAKRQIAVKGTVNEVQLAMSLIEKAIANPNQFRRDSFNEDTSFDEESHFDSEVSKSNVSPLRSSILITSSPTISRTTINDVEGSTLFDDSEGAKSFKMQTSQKISNSPRLSKKIPQQSSKTLRCPLSKVGCLIGTKGSIIKEIMKRTNSTIIIGDIPDPSSGQDYREVSIKGSLVSVLEAEKLVQSIIDFGTKALSVKILGEKGDDLSK